jgi:hypothetical protein
MKLINPNTRSLICVALSFAFAACTTSDKYSFVGYGKQPSTAGPNLETVVLNDQLALLYASNVATVLRCRFTGARITREISSSLQVILAGLAGAGAAFNFGETTLAVLGLGSAAIPEFQGIFNAKGRAECYQDAVRLIEEAQIDYLAHNQQPSSRELTQNGVTLFQRVTASIHVVEKTLAGHLPSVQDMQKATERMSQPGATATTAGDPAFNNQPANGDPPMAKSELAEFTGSRSKRRVTDPDGAPTPVLTVTNIDAELRARNRILATAFERLKGEDLSTALRANDIDPTNPAAGKELLGLKLLTASHLELLDKDANDPAAGKRSAVASITIYRSQANSDSVLTEKLEDGCKVLHLKGFP